MWELDAGVARDLGELVGWTGGDGPAALATALPAQVPSGTTAKLAAVAAGEVPPGADPAAVARRIVEDRHLGRPTPAWSCWALCTVMAALVEHAGLGPAPVAALRRIDERAPVVDLHSVVLVRDGDRTTICDPYFGASVAGPGEAVRERVHGGVRARRVDEADGRWTFEEAHGRGHAATPLRYRLLAPSCDAGDVHALCAVSARFSGAPPTPFASIWRGGIAVDAHTHAEGGCAVREWRWGGTDDVWSGERRVAEHPDWASAAADMGRRVGFPIA